MVRVWLDWIETDFILIQQGFGSILIYTQSHNHIYIYGYDCDRGVVAVILRFPINNNNNIKI